MYAADMPGLGKHGPTGNTLTLANGGDARISTKCYTHCYLVVRDMSILCQSVRTGATICLMRGIGMTDFAWTIQARARADVPCEASTVDPSRQAGTSIGICKRRYVASGVIQPPPHGAVLLQDSAGRRFRPSGEKDGVMGSMSLLKRGHGP